MFPMETLQWAISWNFVMSITSVKRFSSVQRYTIFCDFTSFCVHYDMSCRIFSRENTSIDDKNMEP